jgi:hypothetical protein
VHRRQDPWLERHWPLVRFKKADMKNVRIRGQIQVVGHRPHVLHNLERPVEPRTKLAATMDAKGCNQSVKESQPHPIPHVEHQWAMVLVVGRLVLLLRLLEAITNFHDELVASFQLVVDGRHACGSTRIGRHGKRVMPVDDAERRRAQGALESFDCRGVLECVVYVNGPMGRSLGWLGLCGGRHNPNS